MAQHDEAGQLAGIVDWPSAAAAAVAAYAYRVLRDLPPDAPLWAAGDLPASLTWAAGGGLLGALSGAALARFLPSAPARSEIQLAVRPLFLGALIVLAAAPLRYLVFHDPAPLLLAVGMALGGLASAWRLIAWIADRDAPRVLVGGTLVLGLLMAVVWPPPQGDEPHYLTVTHSLIQDRDLDVADDYADRVFAGYHPEYLSPHAKPGLREGSRYSMHGAGFPVFLAPAYFLGSEWGPWSAVFVPRLLQVFLQGAFAWLVVLLIGRFAGGATVLRGAAALLWTAPVLFAPVHLFPEVVAATLSLGAFLLLTGEPRNVSPWAAGVLLAALPWIGVKYLPLMLATAAAGWLVSRPTLRAAASSASIPAVSCLLHGVFTWTLYGSISPSAVYLGADPSFGPQPGYGADWAAYLGDWPVALATLAGYFLDQKEGLLAVAPLYLVAVAGACLVWRLHRGLAVALVLIMAAHLGPYALSQQIGGQSPPARPMLAIAWVFAVPLAVGMSIEARPLAASVRALLVTASVAFTAFLLWDPRLLPHDYGVSGSWTLRALSPQGWELWRWAPSWLNVSARPIGVNAIGLIVVAVVAAVLLRDARTRQVPEHRTVPFRPAWAAATGSVVAIALLGLAVATVPLTDRHRGVETAPGIQGWILSARPETAWPESSGVWARPGPRRSVVYTTAEPLGEVRVDARTITDGEVGLVVGSWSARQSLEAGMPLATTADVGAGRRWGALRAYRGWLQASNGAPPAVLDGGEDWRLLGVHASVKRGSDE